MDMINRKKYHSILAAAFANAAKFGDRLLPKLLPMRRRAGGRASLLPLDINLVLFISTGFAALA